MDSKGGTDGRHEEVVSPKPLNEKGLAENPLGTGRLAGSLTVRQFIEVSWLICCE